MNQGQRIGNLRDRRQQMRQAGDMQGVAAMNDRIRTMRGGPQTGGPLQPRPQTGGPLQGAPMPQDPYQRPGQPMPRDRAFNAFENLGNGQFQQQPGFMPFPPGSRPPMGGQGGGWGAMPVPEMQQMIGRFEGNQNARQIPPGMQQAMNEGGDMGQQWGAFGGPGSFAQKMGQNAAGFTGQPRPRPGLMAQPPSVGKFLR